MASDRRQSSVENYKRSQLWKWGVVFAILLFLYLLLSPLASQAQDNQCPQYGYEWTRTGFLFRESFYSSGNQNEAGLCQIIFIKEPGERQTWLGSGFVKAMSYYAQLDGPGVTIRYIFVVERGGGFIIKRIVPLSESVQTNPTPNWVIWSNYRWDNTNLDYNDLSLALLGDDRFGQILVLPDGSGGILVEDSANG